MRFDAGKAVMHLLAEARKVLHFVAKMVWCAAIMHRCRMYSVGEAPSVSIRLTDLEAKRQPPSQIVTTTMFASRLAEQGARKA